jgi:hypothetical protein
MRLETGGTAPPEERASSGHRPEFVESFRADWPARRKRLEVLIDEMITCLDGLDAVHAELEDDAYEPSGDESEPSLGSTHDVHQGHAWKAPRALARTSDGYGACFIVDAEFGGDGVAEEDREPGSDDEPSLGSMETAGDGIPGDQARWASGGTDDREAEHDGREPDEDGVTDHIWARSGYGSIAAVEAEALAMRETKARLAAIVARVSQRAGASRCGGVTGTW